VSRNSGTRRVREDTQGHDQGANQVQEDTGGPAGIRKDTSPRRFGTVRPRVQIPGPRPKSEYDDGIMAGAHGGAGSQPYHKLQPVYIEEFIPVSRSPQICRKTFPADTVPSVDRIDPTGMFEDAWNPTPQEIRSWAHTTAYAPGTGLGTCS
jgi:hypothetical protein